MRAPLPERAEDAAPLSAAFGDALDGLLASLDWPLTPAARAAIDAHARLLLAWNVHINLTAVRDPAGVALEHVADSLAAVPLLRSLHLPASASLCDVGSGGGYPGLPVAVALPVGRALLVDSIAKKARFLGVAARAASEAMRAAGGRPPDLRAEAIRAEALAERPADRGAFDIVTVRAVGRLALICPLAMPLVRPGGRLAAWKRDDGSGRLDAEVREAEAPAGRAGARVESIAAVDVPGLEDHRLVVLVRSAARAR